MRLFPLFSALAACAALLPAGLAAEETATPGPIVLEPPIRLKAGEAFIDTGEYTGHAGPVIADLDADGKPDLVVGNFRGHFQIYMNVGTREEPVYASRGLLEADGGTAKVPNW